MMDKKTIFKLILVCLLMAFGSLGIVILILFIESSIMGLLMGGIFAILFILGIISFAIPVWFKDYIEDFWNEEERKKCQKENEAEILNELLQNP
jgi:hypothetical protein